ncbi:MAG: hypothetical protein II525_03970 [Bacteroidales bacterium]|nr:hypothetical protein [Bacteroidales bacterium]
MNTRTFKMSVCALLIAAQPLQAQERGCTDPRAQNYNATATINDGSCRYSSATVTPFFTTELPPAVSSSSGLVCMEGGLYTHNDHREGRMYRLDTATAKITGEMSWLRIRFKDMEDVTADSLYLYLGDFGNNGNGNRNDLHILRILKSTLQEMMPKVDTIAFSYPEQTDTMPVAANSTDWDCEAMIASGDSLYIFTKQWTGLQTMLYALPKTPGKHEARLVDSYAVGGLVTGADLDEENNVVVLCGYSNLLQPFLLLLYDYEGCRFFSGNKRKIALQLPFHQVEAIAGEGGYRYFLTNESFRRGGFNTPARFHRIDLSPFLSDESQK